MSASFTSLMLYPQGTSFTGWVHPRDGLDYGQVKYLLPLLGTEPVFQRLPYSLN
jgi:hypothetical protein